MIDSSGREPARRRLARTLEQRIHNREPGYEPGRVLTSAERLARDLGLGTDTVRDAYALLASMGLVTIRHGYGVTVRAQPNREVIEAPADAVVTARMPTFAEVEQWQMEPGVPMLVIDGRVYPGDRYQVRLPRSTPDP